jgi:hypothetical protein
MDAEDLNDRQANTAARAGCVIRNEIVGHEAGADAGAMRRSHNPILNDSSGDLYRL